MAGNTWHSTDVLHTDPMLKRWQDHFNHPPCVNDLGCFRMQPDPMGIRDFLFPPFSGKGEGTGMLYIDRKHPASEGVPVEYTWYPHMVLRRAAMDGLEIETETCAAPSEPGALIALKLKNVSGRNRNIEVGIKVAGRLIHTIDGWASIGPSIMQGWGSIHTDTCPDGVHPESWRYDPELGAMRFASEAKAFSVHGTRPAPDAVEGKTLLYQVSIPAGECWKLKFAVALGDSEPVAVERFARWADKFEQTCEDSRSHWDRMIREAFQPGNRIFSGHLPTLVTEETDLARLYYMTFLGCLCCRRDNPLSQYGIAYVTLTPNYWTTASFLWDMMIAAPFYALLDPDVLRKMVEIWVRLDLHKYLAVDYVTGKGLGYWYAVNNTAIVRLAFDYLRWTGDFAWLDRPVGDRTVIEHLEHHALAWHGLDKHGHGLADCGGVMNLLECVSTYVHEVAGFNAMWVAALRSVGALWRLRGDEARAKSLEADAARLLKTTMSLYAEGKGYWRCRQPNGSYFDVRHIYDFIAVLESIPEDLPESTRREMVEYFQREHQTPAWMRGLSNWDDDVHRSFRVDLQWSGSYPSLPAQVINGLYKIGCGEMALDWLRRIAPISLQGPLAQAHWVETLLPPHRGGAHKCAPDPTHGVDWTVASNGAYPAMMIESVFGVRATLSDGLQWTGQWHSLDPEARLENLHYQGKEYRVTRKGIEEIG